MSQFGNRLDDKILNTLKDEVGIQNSRMHDPRFQRNYIDKLLFIRIATRCKLGQVRLIFCFLEILRSPYCGKYYSHSAELANGTQYHKSRKQHQKAMKYHDKQVTETFVPTFAEKKKISELPDMIFLWL